VLAHRDVDRRVAVVDGELFVGNGAGEHEAFVEEPASTIRARIIE
jgi:hypothetical protein